MYNVRVSQHGCEMVEISCPTKKAAIVVMSEEDKAASELYDGSGYKKEGSLKKGIIRYVHPIFGCDLLLRITKKL